jgi:uncharacterized phiE125 gp8 family phage protein
MPLRLITAPTSEPVTLQQVKFDAKLDGNEHDDLIDMLIPAVRKKAEDLTHRVLMPQVWELVLDAFPVKDIEIGMLPVTSITSVKYYDGDGTLQTLSTDYYTLDADTLPGFVRLNYGYTWPSTLDQASAVVIRFAAGYASADAVPGEFKTWIRAQTAAAIFQQTGEGQYVVGDFINGLLDGYKLRWV